MHELSEEKLWLLCLEGNQEAFKEIYCRFYSLLYHYGLKLKPDEELVKDCIQDLFIRIIQNHSALSPAVNVRGYLIKALRNKIIDVLEKAKGQENIEGNEEVFFVEDTPFEMEETDVRTLSFMSAFRELSPHQQEIIYLYYVDELKHEDIAAMLGINYQSSKNLLFRTLSKLKKLFSEKSQSE